jgi:hypothetical protein
MARFLKVKRPSLGYGTSAFPNAFACVFAFAFAFAFALNRVIDRAVQFAGFNGMAGVTEERRGILDKPVVAAIYV